MWIRRADYLTLVRELTSLRAAGAVLAREMAIRQQNVDWLTQHVNRLEAERAELLARVLDIRLPVPVISREPADHPELAAAVQLAAPIETRDRTPGDPIGVAASALGISSFEDMGDDLASRLGVKHDPAGNILYG